MPRRGGRHFTVLDGAERAMEAFRMEIAEDLGLLPKLEQGGWTNLTTQEVGSIGGEMVKRIMVAGEMAVVERFKAGERLSPQLPSNIMINNADPRTRKPEKSNESAAMAKVVNQHSPDPQNLQ